ncbi:AraC family ligand binding domain-containing protein [Escherichia coli]
MVKDQGREFVCRPGDILLFPPGEIHHYGRHSEAHEWYHQWVYFRLAPTGMNGLTGRRYLPIPVSFARMKRTSRISATCLGKSLMPDGEGRYSELLAINLLEQLLLRRMEAINESLHPPMDNRVREACQYISDRLADSNFDIASVAQHVCLSPSRLSLCTASS